MNMNEVVRIIIVEHDTHQVFIEDVEKVFFEDTYHGSVEEYVHDNYIGIENATFEIVNYLGYVPSDGDADPVEIKDIESLLNI